MNYRARFEQIREVLRDFSDVWRYEILETYPEHLGPYNPKWIKELSQLSEQDLYNVDIHADSSRLHDKEFINYLETIKRLSEIENYDYPELKKYPSWAFFKVKAKKEHEIKVLSHKLKELKKELSFEELVDIGGGVGHLARFMAHYKGIPTTSIDINQGFQEIGLKRLSKFPLPEGASSVKFINYDFSKRQNFTKENSQVFNKNSFSLGLHTCGPLANSHLRVHLENETKGILNFGCCYNRLNTDEDVNLSNYANSDPIKYTEFSLTLAARGHDSMDFEAFLLKRRVKNYRYMLHIILKEHLHLNIYAVGDSHHRYYSGTFGEYAKHKFQELNIDNEFTNLELDQLFKEHTNILNNMFFANIIRWQLGRLLELSILIDRALYLEENGQRVSLKRYFDKDLSPRNIGLLSIRNREKS